MFLELRSWSKGSRKGEFWVISLVKVLFFVYVGYVRSLFEVCSLEKEIYI